MYKGTNCVKCNKLILKEYELKQGCAGNPIGERLGTHVIRLFDIPLIEPTNPEKPKRKRMTKIEKLIAQAKSLPKLGQ